MVDSSQRFPLARRAPSAALAESYFAWLDGAFGPLVSVEDPGADEVIVRLMGVVALRLRRESIDGGAVQYAVDGGLLAQPGGVFVFADGPEELRVDLLGFVPRLPLWIYRLSHGPVHTWTMARFGRFLETLK